jgi:hypothetical protein
VLYKYVITSAKILFIVEFPRVCHAIIAACEASMIYIAKRRRRRRSQIAGISALLADILTFM